MIKTAIAFLLGCVWILNLAHLPDIHWLWLAAVVLSLTLVFRRWDISFFILGMLWAAMHAYTSLENRLPASLQDQDLAIVGVISSVPQQHNHRLQFEFTPLSSNALPLPKHLHLSWYYPVPDPPQAGESWHFTVRLKRPHGMSNPGSFDYERWLFQEHIGATGYVRPAQHNYRVQAAPWRSIDHWRQYIANYIDTITSASAYSGMLQGLTVCIRDQIRRQQWQVLQQTGTTHLLAISGLHIGLAATLGFLVFRWLWSRSTILLTQVAANRAGAIGGIFFALLYALLAGLSIPTQRALIMVSLVLGSLLLKRRFFPSQVVAFSLLLVLLHDPFAVLSAGFWLSYLAVTLILYISQHRQPATKAGWFRMPIIIAVGLSPFLVLFFNQISLIAPLANFIAVPWISILVVPLALLSVMLIPISVSLSSALFHVDSQLLALLWQLLEWLASLDFASWHTASPPLTYLLLAVVGIAIALAPRGMPAKWCGLVLLLPAILYSPPRPRQGEIWLNLLDVGQGLAVVVETHQHTLVYDTGPAYSSSFDTGAAVILPFLQHQGIGQVNTLIISHGDNDHSGGARSLIHGIHVQQILSSVPKRFHHSQHCQAGQHWQWDGVLFQLLHPSANSNGSDNNQSCVLRISNGQHSILLPGDIEQEAEQQLVSSFGHQLHADILVAPHHGSHTSSSVLFVDSVDPRYVLFATGYHNRYHFPAATVVQRYQQRDITSLNTADSGAITFKINNDISVVPLRWRRQHHRLWSADATE